ncbi:MAG: hypothetical protein Q8L98_03870 [Chlamydiales bacterium]|nr:hypothetical protein [Chlamydiales bacterium]
MGLLNVSGFNVDQLSLITTINDQLDPVNSCKLNFLGNRIVKLNLPQGGREVSLNDLAEMIVDMSDPEKLLLLNCEQRLAAIEMQGKIHLMYATELKGIAGILVRIRDVFCRFVYSTWWNRVHQTIEDDVWRIQEHDVSNFTMFSSYSEQRLQRILKKLPADGAWTDRKPGKLLGNVYIKISHFKDAVGRIQENRKLAEEMIKKSQKDRHVTNLCYQERFEEDPIKFLIDEIVGQGLVSSEKDPAKIFIMSQIPDFGITVTSKDYLLSYVRHESQDLDDHLEIMEDFNKSFEKEQGEAKLAQARELFAEKNFKEAFEVLRELFAILA